VIVEEGHPLSLTSDKSTEAYRNWWPGPDRAMTAFMNRSIDLMEKIARETKNRINLNRRGYLFATGDASKVSWLQEMARTAEARGSGAARLHDTSSSPYAPSPIDGFDFPLAGADIITDASVIRRQFPYLTPKTVAVVHARRAGWLSAQQLGMVMLEAARERGVKLMRGKVVGVERYAPNAGAVAEPASAVAKSGADAILIAQGGVILRAIAPTLSLDGVARDKVKLLGTGLWDDDAQLMREASLLGSWYAAPAPNSDAEFAGKYRADFYDLLKKHDIKLADYKRFN